MSLDTGKYRFRSTYVKPEKENHEVDYTKFIPIATAILILLGVSKLYWYYGLFGVNVIPFLEFGEIVTSFLDRTIVFVLVPIIVGFPFISVRNTLIKTDKNDSNLSLPYSRMLYKNRYPIIFFIVLIAILIYFVYSAIVRGYLHIFIPVFISLFFLMKFASNFLNNTKSKFSLIVAFLAFVIISSEVLIFIDTVSSYRHIKLEHAYYGTRIVFKNEILLKGNSNVVISDSTNYYIGKTSSYVFIHHAKEGNTSVYPMSSVLQIDMPMKYKAFNWLREYIE